ncbi:MAG: molybdenum cofactor biosynthesis protein MoaE [Planctomycetaceae bacterium]
MTAVRSVELTRDPIDATALLEGVRSTQAGAVILFLGTVREMTGGRQTVALDYEGYPDMALAQMHAVVDEAEAHWPIERVSIVHRLGRLELGDISVAIAVSCGHRQQAYAASQHLIDRLKELVPIWKKENWSDGTTEWVHPGTPAPK